MAVVDAEATKCQATSSIIQSQAFPAFRMQSPLNGRPLCVPCDERPESKTVAGWPPVLWTRAWALAVLCCAVASALDRNDTPRHAGDLPPGLTQVCVVQRRRQQGD